MPRSERADDPDPGPLRAGHEIGIREIEPEKTVDLDGTLQEIPIGCASSACLSQDLIPRRASLGRRHTHRSREREKVRRPGQDGVVALHSEHEPIPFLEEAPINPK